MPYIPLHTHSHYSLLFGLSRIDGLIDFAQKNNIKALALTDHHNLYGAIEFYKKCRKTDIKPIFGINAYIAEGSLTNKQPAPDNRTFHIVLLAKNNEGFKNLVKLVTIGHLEGMHYRPRIDKEVLQKHSNGLIALSGDMQGEIARCFWNKDKDRAKEVLSSYKDIFGKDFYIEITRHPHIERHNEIMDELIALAKETQTEIVAAHDSYYLNPEDKEAHRTLLAVQSNHIGEDLRFLSSDGDFSFISPKQAEELFKDIPEGIKNSEKIASDCNVTIESSGWTFPKIETESGLSHDEQLRKFVYEGLTDRKIEKTKEVSDRIEYELEIIKQKGFAPYFLVVADLLYYARKNNILTTIRGSVAGSLVTYLIKITNVDPLLYRLPFERFLNPERPSAPDIDMDFADDRRDEMIAYAKQKYGEDKVAQIGTFGTMLARGVVRDVARALGYPYGVGDKIAKMIPFGSQGFPMTIEKAMKLVPELLEAYEKERDIKEVIDLSKKLEGNARHCSVHAAGVVIAPFPLTDLVPLQREPKGEKIITQYDMHAIEDVGLLKFDFLGIRNLSILSHAVLLVKEIHKKNVDIENIPLDDEKTFNLLSRGETMGLFQLNGAGMTRYLKDLKPSRIQDVNAMVALYRPGPMESIPEYIKRKHNPKLVTYLDPRMKEILIDSYGVITYQDDVMLIAIHLAGYSWLEADKLRKAMGKKILEEMEAQKENLINGFIKGGLTKEAAKELWLLIEPFAAYGFNKAHAASYGKVAYQTAYMKANFPAEYMTAVLTAESGDVEEIARIISETKRMGIEVLPPDINESFGGFTVIKGEHMDKIRFGLYTIKNLGEEIAKAIITQRKDGGKYKDITDFLNRVKHSNLNKRSLEALVKSGAMDALGERGQLLTNIESMLLYNKDNMKQEENQDSLFNLMKDKSTLPSLTLKIGEVIDFSQILAWEKEHLGLYLSGHPLDKFKERFKDKKGIKDIKSLHDGISVVCGGIIEESKVITTKGGERMAFVKVSDFEDSIEVVVFPKAYEQLKEYITPDNCVAVSGKLSHRKDEPSILVEKLKLL